MECSSEGPFPAGERTVRRAATEALVGAELRYAETGRNAVEDPAPSPGCFEGGACRIVAHLMAGGGTRARQWQGNADRRVRDAMGGRRVLEVSDVRSKTR